MNEIYPIGQDIPLYFLQRRNGAGIPDLDVTVKVISAVTGVTILGATSLVESSDFPGLYEYTWTPPSLGMFIECIEIYSVNGRDYVNSFIIQNLSGGGGGGTSCTEIIMNILPTPIIAVTIDPSPAINVTVESSDINATIEPAPSLSVEVIQQNIEITRDEDC